MINKDILLFRSAIRAAQLMGLSEQEAKQIIVSQKTAILLIEVYKELDRLLGVSNENIEVMASWLHSKHYYLGQIPINMLNTRKGLKEVVQYLKGASK